MIPDITDHLSEIFENSSVLLTIQQYLQIKTDKAQLIANDQYEGEAREEIARRFGRLLSYPEKVITDLINNQRD